MSTAASFLDAWRLERDYFYDRNMHGVDWVAMRDRYLPLGGSRGQPRRAEQRNCADGERAIRAAHLRQGGDARKPATTSTSATLGAVLRRDEKAGGYVVEHIYQHDPDLPDQAPPLARPESLVKEGETIVSIDGQSLLNVPTSASCCEAKPASR
jgi:tricorn protease